MNTIYKLTNKINGKPYVGQTIMVVEKRWEKYIGLHCKAQPKLYNALKKYGPDNFTFEVIDTSAIDQHQLNDLEDLYIIKFDSIKNGYNSRSGGSRGKLSNETKQRISNSTSGENNPMFGKLHSEESKRKISESKMGIMNSIETRRKMSASHLGVKLPDEQKRKIAESVKRTLALKRSLRLSVKA